jgi:hypothetical protein
MKRRLERQQEDDNRISNRQFLTREIGCKIQFERRSRQFGRRLKQQTVNCRRHKQTHRKAKAEKPVPMSRRTTTGVSVAKSSRPPSGPRSTTRLRRQTGSPWRPTECMDMLSQLRHPRPRCHPQNGHLVFQAKITSPRATCSLCRARLHDPIGRLLLPGQDDTTRSKLFPSSAEMTVPRPGTGHRLDELDLELVIGLALFPMTVARVRREYNWRSQSGKFICFSPFHFPVANVTFWSISTPCKTEITLRQIGWACFCSSRSFVLRATRHDNAVDDDVIQSPKWTRSIVK